MASPDQDYHLLQTVYVLDRCFMVLARDGAMNVRDFGKALKLVGVLDCGVGQILPKRMQHEIIYGKLTALYGHVAIKCRGGMPSAFYFGHFWLLMSWVMRDERSEAAAMSTDFVRTRFAARKWGHAGLLPSGLAFQ